MGRGVGQQGVLHKEEYWYLEPMTKRPLLGSLSHRGEIAAANGLAPGGHCPDQGAHMGDVEESPRKSLIPRLITRYRFLSL